jgi:hypothetical protein
MLALIDGFGVVAQVIAERSWDTIKYELLRDSDTWAPFSGTAWGRLLIIARFVVNLCARGLIIRPSILVLSKKLYATALRYDRNHCTRCRKRRLYVRNSLFIVDGAFQMTAQELSTILRRALKPIIGSFPTGSEPKTNWRTLWGQEALVLIELVIGRLDAPGPLVSFPQRCAELNFPRLTTVPSPVS